MSAIHAWHYGNTIRRLQLRVAELVGLVSGERLACLAESCGPLPDLGARGWKVAS
jgi:hypothetical protein